MNWKKSFKKQLPLFEVHSHTGTVLSVVRAASKDDAIHAAVCREQTMLSKRYDSPRDVARGMKLFRGAYASVKS